MQLFPQVFHSGNPEKALCKERSHEGQYLIGGAACSCTCILCLGRKYVFDTSKRCKKSFLRSGKILFKHVLEIEIYVQKHLQSTQDIGYTFHRGDFLLFVVV